ncbi:unnamed protein product [Brassicogethes aeneus]|uniref:VWFD domain-containing protein n=1 Tax=Brassicogethes aeneus TaxID=1431903 RepID=A0A9P0B4H9_BRAAE|nr:unnamed protein product [Brassicogethes aeneus]
MLSRDETYVKKSVYQGLYNGVKTGGIKGKYKNHFKRPNKETVQIEEVVCKEYKCVSTKLPPKFIHTKEECPPITCQPSYIAVFDIKQTLNNDCPKYSCHPPPPPDAICNITGRTFNTFDNTEYKFDICNHVIARDLDNDDWEVALKKNCSKYCSRTLVIRHNDNVLSIHSDLSLELDGFSYSVAHIQKIVEKLSEFSIQRVGNVISFESNKYGFWVIWNKHGNVKLGVVNKLMEKVDGLCGYFNSLPKDDKRKPDGSVARTTEDFGESWAVSNDQPKICEAKTCKIHIQNKAWEMCNSVKHKLKLIVDAERINDFEEISEWLSVRETSSKHFKILMTEMQVEVSVYFPSLGVSVKAPSHKYGGKLEGLCGNCNGDPSDDNIIPNNKKAINENELALGWLYDKLPGGQLPEQCGNIEKLECQPLPNDKNPCLQLIDVNKFGQVLLNNTCVSPNDCKVCDDEGHHPGDIWKKDNCTTCTCEGTSLKCETQSCTGSTTICEKGYNAKKIPSKENQCCDKFVCVPEPVAGPTCEPPQEISCGPGQVLKLDTKPNGCRAFICQCKPAKECDKIDLTKFEKLDVGYKLEIDENGCCPLASIVCRQELCSEAKPCPQYYRLESKEIPGKCCPIHTCEPPQEMCIFEAKYISATDGGERLLTKFEKRLELKAGNSSWNDGPCRVCNCLLTSSGSYQFTCKKEDCKELKTFTDFYEYDLVMEHIYDKCCPEPKRIGCKHKGQVYKVQESWPLDKCSTMKCTENSNKIIKETLQITCDSNCEFGHEYIETNNENECCGVCKPIGCVANQKIFKIGENWTSDDYCIEYSCKKINESMQIHSLEVNCLKLKEDFISNFEFSTRTEDGKCCKKYEATACKEGLAIYKVGDTWPSPDGNKCKNITCVRKTNGELSKQESFETCTKDCEKLDGELPNPVPSIADALAYLKLLFQPLGSIWSALDEVFLVFQAITSDKSLLRPRKHFSLSWVGFTTIHDNLLVLFYKRQIVVDSSPSTSSE